MQHLKSVSFETDFSAQTHTLFLNMARVRDKLIYYEIKHMYTFTILFAYIERI